LNSAQQVRRTFGSIANQAAEVDGSLHWERDHVIVAFGVAKLDLESSAFIDGGHSNHRLRIEPRWGAAMHKGAYTPSKDGIPAHPFAAVCGASLHSYRFREVPRLVDVGAAEERRVVGEKLQWHDVENRREKPIMFR
jgi:hypothetical protein